TQIVGFKLGNNEAVDRMLCLALESGGRDDLLQRLERPVSAIVFCDAPGVKKLEKKQRREHRPAASRAEMFTSFQHRESAFSTLCNDAQILRFIRALAELKAQEQNEVTKSAQLLSHTS